MQGHIPVATLELQTFTELAGKIQSKEEKADISLPHAGSELGSGWELAGGVRRV